MSVLEGKLFYLMEARYGAEGSGLSLYIEGLNGIRVELKGAAEP